MSDSPGTLAATIQNRHFLFTWLSPWWPCCLRLKPTQMDAAQRVLVASSELSDPVSFRAGPLPRDFSSVGAHNSLCASAAVSLSTFVCHQVLSSTRPASGPVFLFAQVNQILETHSLFSPLETHCGGQLFMLALIVKALEGNKRSAGTSAHKRSETCVGPQDSIVERTEDCAPSSPSAFSGRAAISSRHPPAWQAHPGRAVQVGGEELCLPFASPRVTDLH